MCKAHSKVTHIKQQKYFHHLMGCGYNKNSVLYPGCLRWWKYFCCFICVTLLWALHIVIKQVFFTFILDKTASLPVTDNRRLKKACNIMVKNIVFKACGVTKLSEVWIYIYNIAVASHIIIAVSDWYLVYSLFRVILLYVYPCHIREF